MDRTFHLYRNNFVLFAGIAALAALTFIAALVLLLALNFTVPRPGPDVSPRAFLWAFAIYFAVIAIFYALGASLAMGATIHAVSKVHLGQPGSIRESYAKVFPRVGRIIVIVLAIIVRMIGMLLLTYLALIPIGVVVGLIAAAAAGLAWVGTILITIIGIGIIVVVYGLVIRVYLKYSLAIQACLLENLGIRDALKRSVFLTEDSLWRIFLIHLLMGVIAFALDFVLHWPIDLFFTHASITTLVLQFLATFVANSIAFPIMTIAVALLYYDQRVRKEALDLQLMMESLDNNPNQAAAATLG
ncbi:MAG TPA: hypothetical protein VI636_01645 [Candidatus Angelobacter sp.]